MCSIRRRSGGASPTGRCCSKALAFFLLSDPQYAETERKAEHGEAVSFAWYIGMARRSGCSGSPRPWLGAYFGGLVADPQALGLDFLLPIYFLGLVMSFRKRPLWLPVVAVSAVASVARLQTRRLALARLDRRACRHRASPRSCRRNERVGGRDDRSR